MLKIGLLGCGFMGKMHASVYSQLANAEVVSVGAKRPERASAFASSIGARSYSEMSEVFSDGEVDVVDICLPTFLHADYAVRAFEAGKDVCCEKPMALTVGDADRMIAACSANGRRLMIGHCIRFWPEYALLKAMVDDKRYGELLSINLTRYGEFPSWSSDNWLADESKAGGGALDMHIHDTDFALYLLGEPTSIVSHGTSDHRGVGQIFTTLTFGATVAHLEGGWNLPPKTPFKMAFRAIFERGAAIMDGGPMTVYPADGEPFVPEFTKMAAEGGGNISDLGGYFLELKYFVERMLSGSPFEVTTPESSRQSLKVALDEIALVKG